MPQRIQSMLNQIKTSWLAIERGKQVRIIVAAVILIAAIGAAAYMLTRPNMVVIETNLDPVTLQQAQTALNDGGIATEIANNTTSLSVPAASVDQARLLLANSSITSSELTYADAINVGIGATEATKSLLEVQAKETEIEHSIKSIYGVKSASVMLSIPNASPFIIRDQDMPSASIMIGTNGDFTTMQAKALALHISKSVQNLKLENIAITDTNGKTLFQQDVDGLGGSSTAQMEIETQKKRDIEEQVRELLAPKYSAVDAMAKIDWDWVKSESSSTTYESPFTDGTTGIPIQQSTSTSTAENTDAGQEPGTQANNGQTPTYPAGTGGSSTATQETSETSFGVNSQTTVQAGSSGGKWLADTSSLAVRVYVNRVYNEDTIRTRGDLADLSWEDFQTNTQLAPVAITIPEAEMQLIRNATGIDNVIIDGYERPVFQDTVSVVRPINQLLMAGLLLLIIGLLAFGLIRRTTPVEITEIEPELSVEELLVSSAPEEPKRHLGEDEEPVQEIDYFAESEIKRAIDKFIEDKPEAAAQLLRNWLTDEWD